MKPMFSQIMATCSVYFYNTDRPTDLQPSEAAESSLAILTTFCRGTSESILESVITAWLSSYTVSDLQRIVRTAEKTMEVSFPSVMASTTHAACARPEVL